MTETGEQEAAAGADGANAAGAPGDWMDAPADRFCDVVMEGGVTSGIIYASAVVELARQYRFQSIGGSSIGAFAAALAAAAEYRRRHGSGEGFKELDALPEKLAAVRKGRTQLERLFQPQPGTRRLFQIFLSTLNNKSGVRYAAAGLREAVHQYRRRVILLAVVLLAIVLVGPLLSVLECARSWAGPGSPAWPAWLNWFTCSFTGLSWIAAALLAVGIAVVGGVLSGVVQDFTRSVVPNGFGLCRGWDPDKPKSLDLAAFLHVSIQKVAGRDPSSDQPLTFRDLWNAPGSPGQMLGFQRTDQRARSINLEVYSSNLSQGRPYRFPLDEEEDMGRLFFRTEELERYFPAELVRYLAAVSTPYAPRSSLDPPAGGDYADLLELPIEDMPIVVAARLAMSFPLLISAVPLHAVDHSRRSIERCWMSDGGLCSNFPIHLFDSFLPMWPTFGISLNTRDRGSARHVWLPRFHTSGRGDRWDHAPEESTWRLFAFLVSIWKTTWHWNDSTMMRMPGVRDRVVRIYLDPGEGGVNIRMSAEKIRRLGEKYGKPAAEDFIRKFVDHQARGWREHRWVRFNTLLVALRDRMENFGKAVDLDRHTEPLVPQIRDAEKEAPLRRDPNHVKPWPSEIPLNAKQVRELLTLVAALRQLERAFDDAGDTRPYRAVPRPSLRIRHPT
ncbi:patatin-like phospholipase family protein [Ramlibacter ginsenosidimutans]|uniref:Patatin-like phospholipase family protein n=1 Tax=Ramlibacter ginsenosidimutans TaxID=502333 RepID=A0A934TQU6_9BURK|nr:patatin-like phospholipase family protein [Ramlibacter ginsenosidimutans]